MPYATAGQRNTRLVIQRPLGTQDAGGTVLPDFEDVLTVYAKKAPLSAREFVAAASAQSEIAGTLKFHRCSELARLNAKWRAVEVETGLILNFVGPFDADGRNYEWTVYFTEAGSVEMESVELSDGSGGSVLIDKYGTNVLLAGTDNG